MSSVTSPPEARVKVVGTRWSFGPFEVSLPDTAHDIVHQRGYCDLTVHPFHPLYCLSAVYLKLRNQVNVSLLPLRFADSLLPRLFVWTGLARAEQLTLTFLCPLYILSCATSFSLVLQKCFTCRLPRISCTLQKNVTWMKPKEEHLVPMQKLLIVLYHLIGWKDICHSASTKSLT